MIFKLTPLEKITKAKIELRKNKNTNFFSFLVSTFKVIETAQINVAGVTQEIKTAAISADKELFYNPTFVDLKSSAQCVFLLAHEVLHYALRHVFRIPKGDHKKANMAMDLKVNDILVTENIGKVIPEGMIPSGHSYQFKKSGYTLSNIHLKTIEEIYEEIPDEDVDNGPSGEGGMDSHICKNATAKDIQQHHRDMAGAVASQQKGFGSSDLQRLFKNIKEPLIPWQDVLARFMQPFINDSYSWSKLNRKTLAQNIILPGYIKSGEVNGVFTADTSGSMSDAMLGDVASEIQGLLNAFASLNIKLLIGDSDLKEEHDMRKSFDITEIKMKGGGGTSHEFVFKYIQENSPAFAIIYSDMESDIKQCFAKYDTNGTAFIFIGTEGCKDMSRYGMMTWITRK